MQQRIGLPMGTNGSPFMANLVLFMYELEYFVEEISKCDVWHCDSPGHELQHQHDRIRRLAFCTRYIDDLWNPLVSANEFKTVVKAIYPSWLELGLEHKGETYFEKFIRSYRPSMKPNAIKVKWQFTTMGS